MAHAPIQQPALDVVATAFTSLERRVHKHHVRMFNDTTLKDVWVAVEEVEKRLAAKAQSRSLRRMKPLLDGLEHYSKTIEVLCNGTPYLPWIWAPIKLCIQIASDHITALEKLVKAYEDIGKTLPRFDILGHAFRQHPDFQHVLAVFYSDILDFHQRAYKVFNDSAWKRFFDSSWTRFDQRFGVVLDSLRKHSDLVDKEANALNIFTLQDWRLKAFENLEKVEKERFDSQFRAVMTWFDVKNYQQDDILNSLIDKSHPGTTAWLLSNPEVNAWLGNSSKNPILWLTGKPGSGKSVLCAQLIQHLQNLNRSPVAFYICSLRTNNQYGLDQALRSIAAKLIQHSRDHAAFVYNDFVLQGATPSISTLKQLVPLLLSAMPGCRLLIDGLDECKQSEQEAMLKVIIPFVFGRPTSTSTNCKLVIFSQDTGYIQRMLKKHTCISLADQSQYLEESIKKYVQHSLADLRLVLDDMEIPDSVMDTIQRTIISKADGMFLWARLVLSSMKDTYSVLELQNVANNLPQGIDEAYGRILDHFNTNLSQDHRSKVSRIFSWLLVTDRPLKINEILDGLALCSPPYSLNDQTKLRRQVLDLCKPLVEVSSEGTVSIVHLSASQFLMHAASGPFLKQRTALYNVTLACATYAEFSMDLVEDQISELERVRSVIKGFHGLHTFAHAHWLDYMVQLIEDEGELDISRSRPLENIIRKLCERYSRLSSSYKNTANNATPANETLIRAEVFSAFQPLRTLAIEIWEADRIHAQEQGMNGRGSNEVFTNISAKYQSIVGQLISPGGETNFPDLATFFPDFRAMQTARPFICTFANCPRKSEGFPSIQERDAHEHSHRPRIMCGEASCQFATAIGFASKAQLNRHTKKYHQVGPRSIPTFPQPRLEKRSASDAEGSTRATVDVSDGSKDEIPLDLDAASSAFPTTPRTGFEDPTDLSQIGNRLSSLDLDTLPLEFQHIGTDWHAVYNPKIEREIEVEQIHSLDHDSVVCSVCFSQDGSRVATTSNHTIRVFDVVTGSELALLRRSSVDDGDLYYRSACFLRDSRFLVSGNESKTVDVWDTDTRQICHSYKGHEQDIYSVDASYDGKLIASGSGDRTMRLWNNETKTLITCVDFEDGVATVRISPDGHFVAVGTLDKHLKVWDCVKGSLMHVEDALRHKDSVYSVDFTHKARKILTASLDKTIKVWESFDEVWKCTGTFDGPANFALSVRSSIDDLWIICGSKDRAVYILDAQTGIVHIMLNGHKNSVIGCAVSRQGTYFASVSGDMRLKLWKYRHLVDSRPR